MDPLSLNDYFRDEDWKEMTRKYDEKFVVHHAAEPFMGVQMSSKKGFTLNVHRAGDCLGEYCCIHNPSDHILKNAPLNWRSDKRQMERICDHGVGHPDPDDLAYHLLIDSEAGWMGIHGCDGCCRGEYSGA